MVLVGPLRVREENYFSVFLNRKSVTIIYSSAYLDPDPNLYFDADPEPELD
jgi:hypothetical protein